MRSPLLIADWRGRAWTHAAACIARSSSWSRPRGGKVLSFNEIFKNERLSGSDPNGFKAIHSGRPRDGGDAYQLRI